MSSNEAGVTSHVLAVAGHGVCKIHVLAFYFQKQSGCFSKGRFCYLVLFGAFFFLGGVIFHLVVESFLPLKRVLNPLPSSILFSLWEEHMQLPLPLQSCFPYF